MSLDVPDDPDLAAAELAFGLIDGEERRAAEARAASDPACAAARDRWTMRAAALAAGFAEQPPAGIWSAIAARLPANDAALAAGAAPGRVRPFLAGALAASLGCGLAAAAAQHMLDLVPAQAERARMAARFAGERRQMQAALVAERSRPRVTLVAVLTGRDRRDSVTISFDPATGKIVSAPAGLGIGKAAAELWVIPADGKPRSLGVIAAGAPGRPQPRAGSADALAPGVTLAVSLEPAGGSPGDAPTGPVILTGTLTPI